MQAGSGGQGRPTFKQRAKVISSKAKAEFKRESDAILLWEWVPSAEGACNYNINITTDDSAFRDLAPPAHAVDSSE